MRNTIAEGRYNLLGNRILETHKNVCLAGQTWEIIKI